MAWQNRMWRSRLTLEGFENRVVPALLADPLPDATPVLVDDVAQATLAAPNPQPPAPAPGQPAPTASISFPPGRNLYPLTITITTADGRTHTVGPINLATHSGKDARDIVFNAMQSAGWNVTKVGDAGLSILGVGSSPITTITELDVENAQGAERGPLISTTPGVTIVSPTPVAPPPRPVPAG
ncbi:MAG: hypothetical protein K2X82_06745 [Gemmataceae bacterium]|nr:hypothetical protein [Gemmataceae bacterium]